MLISNAIVQIPPSFQMNKRKLGTYSSEPQLTRCCCCSKKKATVGREFNSASCHTDKTVEVQLIALSSKLYGHYVVGIMPHPLVAHPLDRVLGGSRNR